MKEDGEQTKRSSKRANNIHFYLNYEIDLKSILRRRRWNGNKQMMHTCVRCERNKNYYMFIKICIMMMSNRIFFWISALCKQNRKNPNNINDIGILLRQSETHIPTYWLVHFVAGEVVVMDEIPACVRSHSMMFKNCAFFCMWTNNSIHCVPSLVLIPVFFQRYHNTIDHRNYTPYIGLIWISLIWAVVVWTSFFWRSKHANLNYYSNQWNCLAFDALNNKKRFWFWWFFPVAVLLSKF